MTWLSRILAVVAPIVAERLIAWIEDRRRAREARDAALREARARAAETASTTTPPTQEDLDDLSKSLDRLRRRYGAARRDPPNPPR